LFIVIASLLSPTGFEWHNTLLDIGANTIVVGILFFLGRILLVDPQQEVDERLEKIELHLNKDSKAMFLTRAEMNLREPMDAFIRQSSDLFLCGISLIATVQGYRGLLREKVKQGARLRFLVLDPESPDVVGISDMWHRPQDHLANDIRGTLADLAVLRGIAESAKTGSVAVRLLTSQPTFSFALRNVGKPDSVLRAELRGGGMEVMTRPGWELRPLDSPWYERLVGACERLWNSSKPWHPTDTKDSLE
jgi:hypothetical protein